MKNNHYQAYLHWRNISAISIVSLSVLLISIHLIYSYRINTLKKIAAPQAILHKDNRYKDLNDILKKIDSQEPWSVIQALIEVMPHNVKVEKYIYHYPTGTDITFRAQNIQAFKKMLDVCSKNSVLKDFHVHETHQEHDSYIFVLKRAAQNQQIEHA